MSAPTPIMFVVNVAVAEALLEATKGTVFATPV
jgi:hypothetical protein